MIADLSLQARRCDVELIGPADAPLLARPYYATGDPGAIVAALAHVPELLEAALPFIGMVLGPSAIPVRTKELVIVRTSAEAGCQFCIDAHSVVALDSGLSVAEVRALRGERTIASTFLDPGERALLEWVDVVTLPGPVRPGDRWAALEYFKDHELVELTVVAAATLMLNRFCTALNLSTDPSVAQRLSDEGLG
ncbi:MAG: hypothetical protein NVS3B21_31160 [Acidimicrobiales bacterium]